jgi:transketolase
VFALAGDGDMMEGISAEAASLAGHLKLGHLCWIYDSNHISIEGTTDITFTENVGARFTACGWQVLQVADANDIEATALALNTFEGTHKRPTLIIVHSHIGYGAPHKQDTAAAHGEPLGTNEARGAIRLAAIDGFARDLRLDARRDCHGRRRPHAPARRAAGVVSRHARHGDAAPRRCQRSGRSLARGDGAARPARQPGTVAPGPAHAGPHALCQRQGCGARCLCTGRRGRRPPPDVLLLASGSEVALCMAAYEELAKKA